jgi:hypothetical protein
MVLEDLEGTSQASFGLAPQSGQDDPVEHDQADESGVDFAQDSVGFLAAPLVELARGLTA